MPTHTEHLAYAYGGPVATGKIKAIPEDFFVDELLGFEPSGEGEHVLVHQCLIDELKQKM